MTSTLLNKLRKQLRPTSDADKTVNEFITSLQKKILQAVVMAGGSYAKGTFIRTNYDIDVFVRFPKGTIDADMSATIKKAIPKAVELHGSRDYYQLRHKGFDFEIVPVQHITDWKEALNVTDMSPLHVKYVASKLNDKQKDDVRLLKLFTKAAGVYGAESHVRGFSGYVLELLIQLHGSFEKLLKASQKWTQPVFFDPAKFYQSEGEALRRLNEAKILSPIIIIDPLQPDRNAAAALPIEAFNIFKERAKLFLKKPSKELFDLKISKTKILKQWKGYKVIFKTKKNPRGKKDIVGAKQRVKHDFTVAQLKYYEFEMVHSEFRFDEKQTVAWYVVKQSTLPKISQRRGPPSSLKVAVESFRLIHPTAFEKEGRWFVNVKRKYTDAKKLIDKTWLGKH